MPGVTARYAHVADTALISAAEGISEQLARRLEGTAFAPPIRIAERRDAKLEEAA